MICLTSDIFPTDHYHIVTGSNCDTYVPMETSGWQGYSNRAHEPSSTAAFLSNPKPGTPLQFNFCPFGGINRSIN